jgi:hypothetical protein
VPQQAALQSFEAAGLYNNPLKGENNVDYLN